MTAFIHGFLVAALLSSCGLREAKDLKDNARKRDAYGKTVYINGDPKLLIEDIEATTEIGLKASEIDPNKTYLLLSSQRFVNQQEVDIQKRPTLAEIEQHNQTTTDNLARPEFQFVWDGDTAVTLRSISGTEEVVELAFSVADDELTVTTLQGEAATLLHYSERDDKGAYSFLLEITDEIATSAMMWFVIVEATPQQEPEQADSKYVFLLGDGVSHATRVQPSKSPTAAATPSF